ncbi:hypothetical protein G9A89_022593 [Geosiphon pyriformis]|nr:hypothetical protein G9A89_022593 [Geosiphon pyriformis]
MKPCRFVIVFWAFLSLTALSIVCPQPISIGLPSRSSSLTTNFPRQLFKREIEEKNTLSPNHSKTADLYTTPDKTLTHVNAETSHINSTLNHPNSEAHKNSQYQVENTNNSIYETGVDKKNNTIFLSTQEEIEALEKETSTIHKVIVILCSLGGGLLLVAIAIAILYWKVRRQQKIVTQVQYNQNHDEDATPLSKVSENNSSTDSRGVSIGNVTSNDGESDFTPISQEKMVTRVHHNYIFPNSPISTIQIESLTSQTTAPSAPPADKVEALNHEVQVSFPIEYSFPPSLSSPPAYTPTAPPLYSLPHLPITQDYVDSSMQEIILNTEGNYLPSVSPTFPCSAVLRMSSVPLPAHVPSLRTNLIRQMSKTKDDVSFGRSFNSQPNSPIDNLEFPASRRTRHQRHNSCEI